MFEATIFDKTLHIITFAVATSLFALSYRAYKKKRNEKFLYVCIAFGVFAVKEGLVTTNSILLDSTNATAVVHILNLVILGLFFRGTVK